MKHLMAALLLTVSLSSCGKEESPESGNDNDSIRYVMPAESSPHEGTWLQWPQKYQYGETYRNRLEATWIEMAREIVSGENLHIIAYNSEAKERIVKQLTDAGVSMAKIDFYLFRTNDVWVRDNGPVFVWSESKELTIEGWGFNGWGGKEPFNYDEQIPSEVAKAANFPFVQLNKKLIVEGGAVEVDGKGSFLATRSSILNKNRNPGVTQSQAEELFHTYLGVTHFIWLDGVAGLDITDMHIDGFARFAGSDTIVTMSPDDLAIWELTNKDINTLYSALNREGQAYKYVTLPLTKNNVVTTYGKDLGYQGSYVNYYITNDKVLVPNYNDPNDKIANAIVQQIYPSRQVVGIDSRNLYANGGMIHCVTQQQPRK
ncbi:MAG: agmatine deiminase family protein [Bacteroidales bacterium]